MGLEFFLNLWQSQPVLFVTERCVLGLGEAGMTLLEIAPGIDIERDILPGMDFEPLIDAPKPMDPRLFLPEAMGLKDQMLSMSLVDRIHYEPSTKTIFLNFAGYTTITATMLSNILATHALSPEVRPRLIQRTREYIRNGFPVLEEWMEQQDGLFSCTPPQASAVSFVRYHLDMNSTELMEKLCREASVFVGAGDSFGMDHHLRVAFGQEREVLADAFARMEKTLRSLI